MKSLKTVDYLRFWTFSIAKKNDYRAEEYLVKFPANVS